MDTEIKLTPDGKYYMATLRPRGFRWAPQPDITAYELAICVPVFTPTGWGNLEMIDQLPPEARRHFVEMK